jgi:hypothetical protein
MLEIATVTMAEGVGFEPTETRASTVFKTVPFVRSGIPPGRATVSGRFSE